MPTAQASRACAQGLTELGAHAIACVGEDRPEANAGGDQAIEFGERDLRLGPRRAIFGGHASTGEPSFVAGPISGRNSRRPTITGTSPRASVSDTKVWQMAAWPKADADCGATPTECVPFFGNAVSSMTRKASAPPTSLSPWSASSRPAEPRPRPRPIRNGAAGRNRPARPARPSGRRSCGRPARSTPPHKAEHTPPRLVAEPIHQRRRHRPSSSRHSAMPRAPKSERESSPHRG